MADDIVISRSAVGISKGRVNPIRHRQPSGSQRDPSAAAPSERPPPRAQEGRRPYSLLLSIGIHRLKSRPSARELSFARRPRKGDKGEKTGM
jgi:hypothetical protein